MHSATDQSRRRHSNLTKHARKRQLQRSIPTLVLDLLRDFGDETHRGDGATSYSFSKKSWKRAATYLSTEAKYFERYRACYVVVASNDAVITAAWMH